MVSHHLVSVKFYVAVFLALLILTFVTREVATIHLGEWNTIVAVGIAVTKATLVVLFFMHIRWSDSVTRVVLVAGLFWLGVLFVLTNSDYLTRGWYLFR